MDIPWLTALVGPDETSPSTVQLCTRAIVLFIYGLICMRVAGRRSFSSLSPFDIFIAIVVGSNISRVMTGKVPFVASLAGTMVVVVMHRLLAIATIRSNWLASFVKGKPDALVREGKVDHDAMQRHDVSNEDLSEALRMQKTERIEDAKLVTFERGGKISVVPRQGTQE